MPRYRLTLAYDGTDFHGWQKQTARDGSQLRTVQRSLEWAVQRVVREPVRVQGASRTDAGVHAVGQVAAFTCSSEIPVARLPMALSSALPDDAQVTRAERVHDGFEPVSDAVAKGYAYRIEHGLGQFGRVGEFSPDLFVRRYVHREWPRLCASAMNEAAALLVGEHDFASFAKSGHGRESTVRRVLRCEVVEEAPHRLRLDVSGNGFLHNMIRIIAGTLVDVGRGRLAPGQVRTILEARDRTKASSTLPPTGLCLMWIEYPELQVEERPDGRSDGRPDERPDAKLEPGNAAENHLESERDE